MKFNYKLAMYILLFIILLLVSALPNPTKFTGL